MISKEISCMSSKRAREQKPIAYQQGKIVASREISNRVKHLIVEPEDPFTWIPGQFIITKTTFDGEEVIADYTIVNLPTTSTFEILVDNHANSRVGNLLHSLDIGETFTFKAPRGRFYLEDVQKDIVFIFRDIGIAAAVPLLEDLVDRKFAGSVTVFVVNTIGFEDISQDLLSKYKDSLEISSTILSPEHYAEEKLAVGKLSKKEMLQLFDPFIDCVFYLSGASEFNKAIRQKLIAIGVDKAFIYREMFG